MAAAGRQPDHGGFAQRRRRAALPRSAGGIHLARAQRLRKEDGIVADFVGYDAPDHFAPHDALFYRLMQGELGTRPKAPGKLRRYRIDLRAKTLREEIVDAGSHEFPMIDPRAALQKHAIGYLTLAVALHDLVKRIDYRSGAAHNFPLRSRCGDRRAGVPARPGGVNDEGWLIVQCLDGSTERAFFALFDAARLDAGPIARIHLPHHLPISFHGWWKADSATCKTGHAGAQSKIPSAIQRAARSLARHPARHGARRPGPIIEERARPAEPAHPPAEHL